MGTSIRYKVPTQSCLVKNESCARRSEERGVRCNILRRKRKLTRKEGKRHRFVHVEIGLHRICGVTCGVGWE